ncbi:protein kinase [Sinomonas sp. R1AF57]|uniref:protein kinase domain-containing protein n=1 Tax=Sinomonas sp. R1AF57 TaxID=2020377 RepID=UPI000B5F534C|nr:protein kinase [Sinomonas sp. R1AF57]ASN51796.1 serine/threonine protein kinase [Sinomonas sp. R1AF57]
MEPLPEIHPSGPSPETAAPALPGYEVVRLLGRGGAGSVWLVREVDGGRMLAAKVLTPGPDAGDGADALALARRELRLSRSREHEHLLPVRAVAAAGAAAGAVALLMDYAPGGSLGNLVRVRGRLGVGECVTVVTPIAQALAALHAEGSTHGDVSPGNILFTAQGKPLLGDFGLARMVGDISLRVGGTPGFRDPASMPGGVPALTADDGGPRAAAAAFRPAARAAAGDVFSLGAVAWFALTGEPPQPTVQRPPLALVVEDVPAELAAAIEAALRDDPRERISAAELARAVFRSARAERVDLAPAVDEDVIPDLLTRLGPEPGRRRRGPRRRSRPLLAAGVRSAKVRARARLLWGGAAVLAATAVLGAIWWPSAPAPRSASTASVPEGARQGPAEAAAAWAGLPDQLRRGAESVDPVQAVQALSEIRGHAIAAKDRELLAAVNVPASETAAADAALLDRLDSAGQRLEGFSARVLSAARDAAAPVPADAAGPAGGARAADGDRDAVVRVRVVTSGYTVRDSAGATVGERAAGVDQELRIVLGREKGRWKVARILPA